MVIILLLFYIYVEQNLFEMDPNLQINVHFKFYFIMSSTWLHVKSGSGLSGGSSAFDENGGRSRGYSERARG